MCCSNISEKSAPGIIKIQKCCCSPTFSHHSELWDFMKSNENQPAQKSIKIIHQTSEKNIVNLSKFYNDNNIENKIFSFDKNFLNTIQQADLCITRAGASTLAELSVLNIPFIAVPLPTSKDNHQLENALFYKNKDCCWLIEQNHFESDIERVLDEIFELKMSLLKKK